MEAPQINPFMFRTVGGTSTTLVSNLLGEWEFLDELTINKFIDSPSSLERLDNFIAKGFVSSSDTDRELFSLAAKKKLYQKWMRGLGKPSLIMVVPTLRCDHQCQYCQVSRAPLYSPSHDIDRSVEDVAQFIHKTADKNFKLEFQGGEPLLRQDFIIDLTQRLLELRNQPFPIVVCSALGPELEPSFLKWAYDSGVQFSVSFDGTKYSHSTVRRSASFDSYERFKIQLEFLQNEGFGDRIGFVGTVNKTNCFSDPQELIESCEILGISRIFTRPISDYGFASTTSSLLGITPDEFIGQRERYLTAIVDHFQRTGRVFTDEYFSIYLNKIFRPDDNSYVDLESPSGYGLRACLINYDGHVYGSDEARMLFEMTKDTSLAITHVSDKKVFKTDLKLHSRLLKNTFIEETPHCESCAYSPFCGSDPLSHLISEGDILGDKPRSTFCRTQMGMFDLIFDNLHRKTIPEELLKAWTLPSV